MVSGIPQPGAPWGASAGMGHLQEGSICKSASSHIGPRGRDMSGVLWKRPEAWVTGVRVEVKLVG